MNDEYAEIMAYLGRPILKSSHTSGMETNENGFCDYEKLSPE